MEITVHGGADRIGGSCIEIATGTTRIILDCGWPLEEGTNFTPPAVPGLFTDGTPPDAVLLSHAHPDHTGFIRDFQPSIQIHATKDTSKIMKIGSLYAAGVEIPRSGFNEVRVPRSWKEPIHRFPLGDLQITAYPVDHSSPGSVGYLIEHAGERIFYTGDLRFHGRKKGMHERIERDLGGNLDLLITEGTNVGREQTGLESEEKVEQRAAELMCESASLVMVAYSPQNLDRFVSYYRAAISAARTFVCDHYQAAVLYQLNNDALPKPSRDKLRIYLPKKRAKVAAYENQFANAVVTLGSILVAPDRFVMLVRPPMILDDFSGCLPGKTRLLYGMWSGYRKRLDWLDAERAIESIGGALIGCHASGHAHSNDLFSFIERLNPMRILPVHTEARIEFQRRFGEKCTDVTSSSSNQP